MVLGAKACNDMMRSLEHGKHQSYGYIMYGRLNVVRHMTYTVTAQYGAVAHVHVDRSGRSRVHESLRGMF